MLFFPLWGARGIISVRLQNDYADRNVVSGKMESLPTWLALTCNLIRDRPLKGKVSSKKNLRNIVG